MDDEMEKHIPIQQIGDLDAYSRGISSIISYLLDEDSLKEMFKDTPKDKQRILLKVQLVWFFFFWFFF